MQRPFWRSVAVGNNKSERVDLHATDAFTVLTNSMISKVTLTIACGV